LTHPPKKGRWWALAILTLAGLLIILERCHTYSEPLERDITTYAVIGEELLKGRALYSDLWDHKPPAIHLTFALAEAIAGEGPLAVFLLNVLAALATLVGLYQAGNRLGGRAGGFWAAAIWAVLCGDLVLQANQPNEEVFLNALQAWVFALWLSADPKKPEPRRWVLIGALCAIASLYKPFAVLEALALCAASLVLHWNSKLLRRNIFRQAATVFACVLAAWAGVSGWFALQGRWGDFRDAVFTYNFYYSGYHADSLSDLLRNIGSQVLNLPAPGWLFLLFAIACFGFSVAAKKKQGLGSWLFWATFLLAAVLELFLPGRFFAHYEQLLLPPLVLGAAWGTSAIGENTGKKYWKCLPGAILLVLLIFHEVPFYRLAPEEWAKRKYAADGPLFLQSYQLGRELDGMLEPGETFYEWGNESELYFAARRSPPSGVFYSYPLLDNPLAGDLAARVVTDLEKTRPEVVVLNMGYYTSADLFLRHPVLRWVKANYRTLPESYYREPFLLLILKGGNLEKRLAAEKP